MAMMPRRIHITGNAGSGKTTLANRLGSELRLPVFSLDSVVWQRGWLKTPQDSRALAEEQMVSAPNWIIEGVSSRVRRAADVVLFLEVPLPVCLARALRRTVRHLGQQRPEFPPGCPEWQVLPKLLKIIWSFQGGAGLEIRHEAAEYPERFRAIRRGSEVDQLIEEWLAG
jgi:adenylate kinase family enzyme